MRYLAVLLVFSTFLFSCKKKYHVVGRVYNPVTGEGIENVKIRFSRGNLDGLAGGDEEATSTLTDSDGYYDLEFKGRAERVKISDDGTYYVFGTLKEGVYQQALQLEAKKTQQIDWHVVQYGQLKMTLNNTSCENTSDVIILSAVYRTKPDAGIFGVGTYYGCYNNTTTTSEIPMGYYDLTWTVTKTSTGTNTFTGEVFVPAGGLGEITINY